MAKAGRRISRGVFIGKVSRACHAGYVDACPFSVLKVQVRIRDHNSIYDVKEDTVAGPVWNRVSHGGEVSGVERKAPSVRFCNCWRWSAIGAFAGSC